MTRRSRPVALVAGLALVAAGATALIRWVTGPQPAGTACLATSSSASYLLELEQARNATTVAAVGKRLGLPDHAVTVALAAALQESKLHNLDHGDLDSLGLFQQRPSQGWGTAGQIMVPRYAAAAFYGRLVLVPGWQTMSVTEAAQAVQHSAAPDAYAGWESEARALAQALTGEVPAALACHSGSPPGATLGVALRAAAAQDLGSPALGAAVGPARGWTVATWLVGHASQYRIHFVSFAGRRWTPTERAWTSDPQAQPTTVQVG